jgi:hypothetical protein
MLIATLHEQPSGAFGQKEDQDGEKKQNTIKSGQRNLIGRFRGVVFGYVINRDSIDPDTEDRHEWAAQVCWRDFSDTNVDEEAIRDTV